jgi:hypothetical protein
MFSMPFCITHWPGCIFTLSTGIFLGRKHIIVDLITVSHCIESEIVVLAFNLLLIISESIWVVCVDRSLINFSITYDFFELALEIIN